VLQILERPLSDRERQSLTRTLEAVPRITSLGTTLRWFAIWVSLLALCLFLFGVGLFREGGPTGLWMVLIPVVVIVGIGAFYLACLVISSHIHWSRYAKRFALEDAPAFRAALEKGEAYVCQVKSESAVVIQQFEDEGSAYIFDLGDGTSLYLRGQWYFPDDDDAPWPARDFEIVRTAPKGILVGVFPGLEPVPKIREVSMAEMPESFWWSERPETETILTGSPDEILVSLGHKDAEQSLAAESR